ncbi:S-adenosyl-L-methionine-dependent methyltransferase [Microdochium trichocladiopsis]|uniref:S-adenosyl-L-methionine-dependent methyltransferase n=1 Tax=Microdochium trichocladiopsis TaxID=1682393 RepID=A0A9P9BPD7_9PEZI|nr:S-adenosyl-L-methionine-dependent methyltransferase [Microdochium trichocladiopsis]KAH7024446.1 S-adenosyl-L-methionine-dependent methyltransferase [Microdochium trichocladiopsis]
MSLQAVMNFDNFHKAKLVEDMASKSMLRPNPRLEQTLASSTAAGIPPISVRPMAGQFLSVLTRAMGAKSVLEIGTLGGYSAILFAEAGARVTTVEIDPKCHEVAVENTKGLDIEVVLGSGLEVMPRLAEEGKKFDMVFIDAHLDDEWEHFDWAVKLTRPGGCIVLDDVVAALFYKGLVNEDEGAAKETFMGRIGSDERVSVALMPTVATHPMSPTPMFNGFIMATVLGE